jgi:membrane protein DedA with SNARE-associated domain
MLAGIRGAMVVAAGTTRFNFFKFIIADALAAIVSGGTFIALGIWFGSNVGTMLEKAEEFKIALTIISAVLIIALIIYIRWRMSRNKTIGQVVVDQVEKVATEHPPQSN